MGPNVKRLIALKMARDTNINDFTDGVRFLIDSEKLSESAIKAKEWVLEAIHLLKIARESPFDLFTSDEIVAEAILQEIEKRKKENGN